MAAQNALNPMLQTLAANRAPQANGTAQAGANQAGNGAPSFSQALQSANRRNTESAPQPPASTPAPASTSATATQVNSASQGATQGTASGTGQARGSAQQKDTAPQDTSAIPDISAQTLAALLALQAALGKTGTTDAGASKSADSDAAAGITASDTSGTDPTQILALAVQTTTLTITPTAEAAAPTASLAANPASTPGTPTLADGVQAAPADLTDRKTALADAATQGGQTGTGEEPSGSKSGHRAPLAQVDEGLRTQETPRETTNTAQSSPHQSFASELGHAQASYAAKLDTPPSTQSVAQHLIHTPFGTRNWADEVGQRVSWVANKDSGRADLTLTPPQMGKIEVSINLNGDQASASFTAANQATRDALQDAMPRLREILADAGIQLGQTSVNAGNSGQTQAEQQSAARQASAQAASALGLPGSASQSGEVLARVPQRSNALVDLFA